MKTSSLIHKKSHRILIALAAVYMPIVGQAALAETITILHNFAGFPNDGSEPLATVVEGTDGRLYGTTLHGGFDLGAPYNNTGTAFTVGKDGSGYGVLYSFIAGAPPIGDAAGPSASLLAGGNGWLYGTTAGYIGYPDAPAYAGAVFAVAENGSQYNVQVLGAPTTRGGPVAAVIQGSEGGVLYGTSLEGLSNDGNGYVFRINTDGSQFAVLHQFTGGPNDGSHPAAALLEGTDGALYGTTASGGCCIRGTVFTVQKDGTGYSVLFHFTGGAANPRGQLLEVGGVLYGTSAGENGGTVFSIAKDGTGFAIVHTFNGPDGYNPDGPLAMGPDGALYGTAPGGGTIVPSHGVVFKVNTDGTGFATVHEFAGVPSGDTPHGGVTFGSDGAIYGTTQHGGSGPSGYPGTVYRIDL